MAELPGQPLAHIPLPHPSLCIVAGSPPPPQVLSNALRGIYCAAGPSSPPPLVFTFTQIVSLSFSRLPQLCNFIRRCRGERMINKYLVMLDFMPHRETWHFLTVFRELNVSVVLTGQLCSMRAIRELFAHVPKAIIEWHDQQLLCVQEVTGQCRSGILAGSGTYNSGGNGTKNTNAVFQAWLRDRKPLTFCTAETFASMETFQRKTTTAEPRGEQQHQHTQQQQKRHKFYSHSGGGINGLTLAEACSVLGLTEAQSTEAAAVKRAYRLLAVRYHPDKQQHANERAKQEASAKFQRVHEAKQCICSVHGLTL